MWMRMWISFQQSASGQIVLPIYRTRFIAVQVPAVGCKRDEVPHKVSYESTRIHSCPITRLEAPLKVSAPHIVGLTGRSIRRLLHRCVRAALPVHH